MFMVVWPIAKTWLVVVLALIDLGWMLLQDVLKPPLFILEVGDLLEIFGFFLAVPFNGTQFHDREY